MSCTGGRGTLRLPETMLSSGSLQKWQHKQGQCFHSQCSPTFWHFSRFHLSLIMMPLYTPCLPCLLFSVTSFTYCIPSAKAELPPSQTGDCLDLPTSFCCLWARLIIWKVKEASVSMYHQWNHYQQSYIFAVAFCGISLSRILYVSNSKCIYPLCRPHAWQLLMISLSKPFFWDI